MSRLIVVGGGWAGCSAVLSAAKKGLSATLVERTDRLLGSGLVGGIMRNNGRFTAAEELIMMGGGELVGLTDRLCRHANLSFPGHRHAWLYDIDKVEKEVARLLNRWRVEVRYEQRAVEVELSGKRILAVKLADGTQLKGEVFIDASGTAGPMANCRRFGNGCSMCIFRCPLFGPRVSIALKAGLKERVITRDDRQPGFFSGSCELEPRSLSGRLLAEVREKGAVAVPVPRELRPMEPGNTLLKVKACHQYTLQEYEDNLILLDTGPVKLMIPYFNLQKLRRLEGFNGAVFKDPLGGGRGNSIRFTSSIEVNDSLLVPPFTNLFAAGERAGLMVGHTEAMVTGTLAGYNAWRLARGEKLLILPRDTACGELIAYARKQGSTPMGRREMYTLSGGSLWEKLLGKGLYATEPEKLSPRLAKAGLLGIFNPD